jgi:hypothetical protein
VEELPKNKAADYVYAAARASASLVPIAGGPLQVLLEAVIASPVGKRKDAWMQNLADVVEELQKRVEGLTPERLAENDMFVTAVAQASQIAVRTHQVKKIEALKNAVYHSGLPDAPDEDQQLMFFRFVDEFTSWHLRMLDFFRNPGVWFKENDRPLPNMDSGGMNTVVESAFPELRGHSAFYGQLFRDLQARGLIQNGQLLGVTMSLQGLLNPRTTDFGNTFLEYIS